MTLVNQNFSVYAGDTVPILLTVYRPDMVTPYDLTGASVSWKLSKSSVVSVTKDSTSGISIIDAINGKISFMLAPSETSSLSGIYNHSAKVVTDSGENVSTVCTGLANFMTP